MAAKSVKLKDLQTATARSITALLGKKYIGRPGVLAGFWIGDEDLNNLAVTPTALAKKVASSVKLASGIAVKGATQPVRGGVLVGYIQPKILKEE